MIYSDIVQFKKILTKKIYYYCYVIFGNNEFLLDNTRNLIIKYVKSFHHYESIHFLLENASVWEKILNISQTQSLFNHKKKFFY